MLFEHHHIIHTVKYTNCKESGRAELHILCIFGLFLLHYSRWAGFVHNVRRGEGERGEGRGEGRGGEGEEKGRGRGNEREG